MESNRNVIGKVRYSFKGNYSFIDFLNVPEMEIRFNSQEIPSWRENILQALGTFIQATGCFNQKEHYVNVSVYVR